MAMSLRSSSKSVLDRPCGDHCEFPTYGELIDLLEVSLDADELCSRFKFSFPNIKIGRSDRFFDTVKRLAAPTKSSLHGESVIKGKQLQSYRKQIWKPRIRRTNFDVTFPSELLEYGLDEKLLTIIIDQSQSGIRPLKWNLKEVPKLEFYHKLHSYLKKWPKSCQMSKSSIGEFYMAIDKRLEALGFRKDNVYQYIERVFSISPEKIMTYGMECQILEKHKELKVCTNQVEELTLEITMLKEELEKSKRDWQLSLMQTTNILERICKERNNARLKAKALKEYNNFLKTEIADVLENNSELADILSDFETTETTDPSECFTFNTKCGRRYSSTIRKLYYSLLSSEIPTSRINEIVMSVVKCFNPSINCADLKLPQKSCASYMRKEELLLTQQAVEGKGFKLNTDGTTKQQKKLAGIGINNLVIGVKEVPDGTADSTITAISTELNKLRKTAYSLQLPNADSINWTLFVASNSDSAATQKKVNKLIEEQRQFDEELYGQATVGAYDVIEMFCSMHLAINLRKAFLTGIETDISDGCSERYHPVDSFVYEFCKLFGTSGTPEYTCGNSFCRLYTKKSI